MPLNSINFNPRAARQIASIFKENKKNLTVFDVGARGGGGSYLKCFDEVLHLVGFEPDETECKKLNHDYRGTNQKFFPYALHEGGGLRDFYVTSSPGSSGFNKINHSFSKRYSGFNSNEVVKTIQVNSISLDEFVKQNDYPNIDFLKVDTEGAELAVLKGATNSLKNKKTLGVLVEVWWDKLKDVPSFAELDSFLRSQGFYFYDLKLNYHPRTTLPAGKLDGLFESSEQKLRYWSSPEKRGQALTGDALYFRDPIADFETKNNGFEWNEDSIIKLVALLDVFNFGDAGIELLDFYRNKLGKSFNADQLIDLLTPDIDGNYLRYSDYFEFSKKLLRSTPPPRPQYTPPEAREVSSDEDPILKLPQSFTAIPMPTESSATYNLEELGELRSKNRELAQTLGVFLNSKSWKMTAPLRWFAKTVYNQLSSLHKSQSV